MPRPASHPDVAPIGPDRPDEPAATAQDLALRLVEEEALRAEAERDLEEATYGLHLTLLKLEQCEDRQDALRAEHAAEVAALGVELERERAAREAAERRIEALERRLATAVEVETSLHHYVDRKETQLAHLRDALLRARPEPPSAEAGGAA